MTVLLVDIREDRQKVARAVTERGYVAPVVLDQTGEVTEAYGIHATPTAFLIARDGTIELGHLAELWQIGEVVGGLGAVEQPQPPALSRQHGLSNHGAYRRDASAAGDEQKASFRRPRREQERAERSLNAQAHPRRDRVEQVAPPS